MTTWRAVTVTLGALLFTWVGLPAAFAQGERSASNDQNLPTVVMGLITLVSTVGVMYVIARGGFSKKRGPD